MASLAVKFASSVWRLDGAPEHQFSYDNMQETSSSCLSGPGSDSEDRNGTA